MQQPPPARKGPYLKTLKHVHTEQITRLQAKNQHECDLLEDIRNFTKQRSTIEKTYAEALLKLSTSYLNKKIPSIPDLRDDDDVEQWNVWNVWRTVLEENEKLAKARLAAVEVFQQQITEDAKIVRHIKLGGYKKSLENLKVVQSELQMSVCDLDRHKKFYFDEEHMAHEIRDKARDAEERLKKKKGSIFSSITSLQRSSVKFSSKKEILEEKSTGARNDYLISLATANAHSDRYFDVDLDNCLRILEAEVYDKLKEYLIVMGRTELLTCSAAQNSFSKIRDQAQMLTRDYNVMCCVQYYPVLKQHIRYPFESCEGDHTKKITGDHGTAPLLSGSAQGYANRIGRCVKTIREQQKRLKHLLTMRDAGHKVDPEDQSGPDIEFKIEESREMIRRAETEMVKAEAVIGVLRAGGVNVDEFMASIEKLPTVPNTTIVPGKSTRGSTSRPPKPASFKKNNEPSGPVQMPSFQQIKHISKPKTTSESSDSEANESSADNTKESVEVFKKNENDEDESEEEDTDAKIEKERKRIEALAATWEDPTAVDWGDTSNALEPPTEESPQDEDNNQTKRESWAADPGTSEPGQTKCIALYTYTAQNPDELSIVENEQLDLIGEGDGDGWVRARNYKGEEGYVPQNYVEIEQGPSSAGLQPQISFSSVDYHVHVQEENKTMMEGGGGSTTQYGEDEYGEEDVGQRNGISNGYYDGPETRGPGDDDDYYSSGRGGQAMTTTTTEEIPAQTTGPTTISTGGTTTPFINELRGEETDGEFCRALYDYESTAPEELSFYESQIIRITSRSRYDDDDGWWSGEYDGRGGLFPSIVVEECKWNGEPFTPDENEEEDEEEEDEELSDSGICPPSYTPPEVPGHLLPPEQVTVSITQPTPTRGFSVTDFPDDDEFSRDVKVVEEEEEEEQPKINTKPTVVAEIPKAPQTQSQPLPARPASASVRPFEMELNFEQQQKYQGARSIVSSSNSIRTSCMTSAEIEINIDKPDDDEDTSDPSPPTICIKDPPKEEGGEGGGSGGQSGGDDSGLEVTQIVITAATPMSEERRKFPGEKDDGKKVDKKKKKTGGDFGQEDFADFSQVQEAIDALDESIKDEDDDDDGIEDMDHAAFEANFAFMGTTTSKEKEKEKEEDEEEKDQDTQMEPPIKPPQNTSSISAIKVTSISLEETKESPVTPEELDMHNLAKLETLKESDA